MLDCFCLNLKNKADEPTEILQNFCLTRVFEVSKNYLYIYIYIGWNYKIVVLKKTTLQLYFELYSGASPISLVEHCVTFRHDRRLLSLLGFVHNWPTRRWSAKKKKKKVNRFSLNGMESGRLF